MTFKAIEGTRTTILSGVDVNDNAALTTLLKTVACPRSNCPGVVGVDCFVAPGVHIERAFALEQSGTPDDRRVLKAAFRRAEGVIVTRR